MASNYTTNYQLNQWEAGDQVLRTEFNQDNQKIDTALAGLAAKNTKLETAVLNKGNCQLWTTSYVGTGSGFTTVIFPQKPRLVFVTGVDNRYSITLVQGVTSAFTNFGRYAYNVQVTWSETGVTFYQPDGYQDYQCNQSGVTYLVVAVIAVDE